MTHQAVAFLAPVVAPPQAPIVQVFPPSPADRVQPTPPAARSGLSLVVAVTGVAAAHGALSRRRQRRTRRSAVPAGLEDKLVDEAVLLEKSSFPIKPEDLIYRCKEVLAKSVGVAKGGELDLADDFEFCAPFVGPIPKKDYLEALGTFKIQEAFPDTTPNYHCFRVDPFEPDRVWFQTRKTGTNTGEFLNKPPTNKALTFPPENHSLRFNAEGKVTEFCSSYPIDRRVGNTGGLGGAFGYFYGVGRPLPIPECQPYKRSWQFRFLSFMANATKRFQGVKIEKK